MKNHHLNVASLMLSAVLVLAVALVPLIGEAEASQTLKVLLEPSSSVNMNEKASDHYYVKLNEEPDQDVTVGLSFANNEEISSGRYLLSFQGSGNTKTQTKTLTFTTQNWDQKQTVWLASDIDKDFENETVYVNHLISGGGHSPVTLTVNIADIGNEEAQIVVSPTSVAVKEGSMDLRGNPSDTIPRSFYTVKLSKQPEEPVNVTLKSNTTETVYKVDSEGNTLSDTLDLLSIEPKILFFNSSNWNQGQVVALRSPPDSDNQNESIKITHTGVFASGNDSYFRQKEVMVTIDDNDKNFSLVLNPSEQLTVLEGQQKTYTIKLGDRPDSNVRVAITSNDPGKANVSTSALTFTRQNWNIAKTVTVTTTHDEDSYDEDVVITHDPKGGGYDTVADVTLGVVVDDDDLVNPQLNITPSTTLLVKEGQESTYEINLTEQPNANVVVSITSGNTSALRIETPRLTFTRENWNETQTVRVTGRHDNDNANEQLNITHNSQGGGYDDVDNVLLEAIVDDDEPVDPGLDIVPTQLSIDEGKSRTYDIKLNETPSSTVTVSISSSDTSLLTVSPTTLRFTTQNWDTDQTVTATAKNDTDNNDEELSINHNSQGGGYDTIDNIKVAVLIDDSGPSNPRIVTSNPTPLNDESLVAEGTPFNYSVKLNEKPTGDVTVRIRSISGSLKINSSSSLTLTFTNENWNTGQIVTGIANDDDSINTPYTIEHAASGGGFNGVSFDLVINTADDDVPELMLQPTELVVDEGRSANYRVWLKTKPSSTVRVNISADQVENLSVSRQTLTFTTSNWKNPQTVTVRAAHDPDDDDRVDLEVEHTVTGAEYDPTVVSDNREDTIDKKLKVRVNDDEAADFRVVITPSRIPDIIENHPTKNVFTYNVRLNIQPKDGQNIDVSVVSNDTQAAIVDQESLQFDRDSWNVTKQVQITAQEDSDNLDERVKISHTFTTQGLVGAQGKDIFVTVKDDEPKNPQILIKRKLLVIKEEQSEDYTVKLSQKPTGEVTVTMQNPDNNADFPFSVTPETLTFSETNWYIEQTVTVSATDDGNGIDESGVINHTATGGGYQNIKQKPQVRVLADDDDPENPEIVTSIGNKLKIKEGESETYKIRLREKPNANVTIAIAVEGEPASPEEHITTNPAGDNALVFTTSNWKTWQTVTVTGVHDNNHVAEDLNITHTASGGGYLHRAPSVTIVVNLTDDDPTNPGITLSKSSIEVEELGESASYTVRLTQKPSATVQVNISLETDIEEITITPETLTFDSSNWHLPKTVTLKAVDHAGTDDTSTQLIHKAYGGGYRTETEEYVEEKIPLTLKNDDPESPSVEITPSPATVEEGTASIHKIKLGEQPSRDNKSVTVSLSAENVTVFPTTFKFTRKNWNTSQILQIFASHDDDTADEEGSITYSALGAGYAIENTILPIQIDDDEPVGPRINLTKTLLAIEEGDKETYSLNLSEKPNATVTVTITSDNSDVTPQPSKLTFTRSNWDVAQKITVTASQDQGGLDDVATLSNNATGGGYEGQSEVVSVFVTDDEPSDPDMIIWPYPSININENGNASYTIKLSERPIDTVSVALSVANSDIVPNPRNVIFTPSDWNEAKTVNLTARDDAGIDDEEINLTHTASGGGYTGLSVNLTVNLKDDDSVGIKITPTTIEVPEGESSTYTVELKTQPNSSVTVSMTADSSKIQSINPSSVTFTTTNWDVPKTITVLAKQDDDKADDNFIITHDSASQDTGYDNVDGVYLIGRINDDELADAKLKINISSRNMNEEETLTYSVSLNTQPESAVTVNIVSGDNSKLTPSPASLQFTNVNWNVSQNITLTSKEDADGTNENITVTHYSNGGGYNNVRDQLLIKIADDEPENPTIVLSRTSLNLTEGGSGVYFVDLNDKPKSNVTVSLVLNQTSSATLDKSSLTFTTQNWNSAQPVRVTAVQDQNSDSEMLKVIHTASGGGFNNARSELNISINDDEPDAPDIVVQDKVTVIEGEPKEYNVKLAQKPGGNVAVNLQVTGSLALSASPSSLVFTSSNWDIAKKVTVSADQDNDKIDDAARITYTASGGGYDGVQKTTNVTIKDDDPVHPSIILESVITIEEGQTESYKIKLGQRPGGNVVVNLGSGHASLSFSSSTLYFSKSDWNVSKSVAVTAGHDSDNNDEHTKIVHTASGGGYDGVEANATVTIYDDEPGSPSILLGSSPITVREGSSQTYTIKLGEKPSGIVNIDMVSSSSALTFSSSRISFTRSNWDKNQTVRISAGQDQNNRDESVQITHTASGGGYQGVQVTANVQIEDDEIKNPDVVTSPSRLRITEGQSAIYTAHLREAPRGNVEVRINTNRATATVSPTSITFTTSNWNQSQTVTVTLSQDSDTSNDVALITHSMSGGGYDGAVSELMVDMIDASPPQNNTGGTPPPPQTAEYAIILSRSSLDIDEGDEKSYRVKLSRAPTDTVTVRIKSSESTVDVSPRTIKFTTSNWDKYEEVDVEADSDSDTRDEEGVLTHTASGGGYDNAKEVELDVDVEDDDEEKEESEAEKTAVPATSSISLPKFKSSYEIVSQTSTAWPTWSPGRSYKTDLKNRNVLINDISFNTAGGSTDPIAYIAKLASRPGLAGTNPAGVDAVYGFFEIALNDAAKKNSNNAVISFTIDDRWLESGGYNAESIKLWGWDEAARTWVAFSINSAGTSAAGTSFSSQISLNMPFFAITANRGTESEIEVQTPQVEVIEWPVTQPAQPVTPPPVKETQAYSFGDHEFEFELEMIPILVALGALILILFGLFFVFKI